MANTSPASPQGDAVHVPAAVLRNLEGLALHHVAVGIADTILEALQARGALPVALISQERDTWRSVVAGALGRLPDGAPVFWKGIISAIRQEVESRQTPA